MGDGMPQKTLFLPSTWGLLRGSFATGALGFQNSYIQLLVQNFLSPPSPRT